MAKTAQQYTDEYYNSGKKVIDTQLQQRQQTDQQTISDIDAALTKSAQAAADKYQKQIDAAPGEAHASFAKNELQEALGRQRAELKMANMGLTDSGLSDTSQAALSVQKANANANTRRDMQNLVSGLETAISDVWTKKESELAEKTMSINKTTDDWYTATMAQLATDAQTAGANAYAADQQAAAAVEAARIKARQEAEAADAARQHELNLKLLDNGYSYEEVYGASATTAADPLTKAMKNVNKTTYVPDNSWGWWLSNYDEARWFTEETEKALKTEQWYSSADEETRQYALAIAAGKSLWNSSSRWYEEGDHKEEYIKGLASKFKGDYLTAALEAAGLGTVEAAVEDGYLNDYQTGYNSITTSAVAPSTTTATGLPSERKLVNPYAGGTSGAATASLPFIPIK